MSSVELDEVTFELAMMGANGSFLDMLEDIYEKWSNGSVLSARQTEVVINAAERASDALHAKQFKRPEGRLTGRPTLRRR